jgi:hypothetical protein
MGQISFWAANNSSSSQQILRNCATQIFITVLKKYYNNIPFLTQFLLPYRRTENQKFNYMFRHI